MNNIHLNNYLNLLYMSYYENNFVEKNMENYNNLEEGYNDGDSFYYLTENEQIVDVLDDNIYQEDNYLEHMENQRQSQIKQAEVNPVNPVVNPVNPVVNQVNPVVNQVIPFAPAPNVVKSKKHKKSKSGEKLNWLYILLVIVIISLITYFLIDQKIIKIPSFGSSASTSSPSSSSFKSTLGSTFMSLK